MENQGDFIDNQVHIQQIGRYILYMKKQSVKKWFKSWFQARQSSSNSQKTSQITQSEHPDEYWTQAQAEIVNHLINMDSIIKISKQISEQEYSTLSAINQILCQENIDIGQARKALIGGINTIVEVKDLKEKKDNKNNKDNKQQKNNTLTAFQKYITKNLPYQYYSVRSLLWKVSIGYLMPGNKEKWISLLQKNLALYIKNVVTYIAQPIEKKLGLGQLADLRKVTSVEEKYKQREKEKAREKERESDKEKIRSLGEVVIKAENQEKVKDHPLNFSQQSKWGNYFKDVELWKTIQKDIKRTKKSCKFFDQPHQFPIPPTQTCLKPCQLQFSPDPHPPTYSDSLTRILFIYLKSHPTQNYCQGMNQIIALIYYGFTNKNSQYFRRVSQSDAYFVFQIVMGRLPRKHFQRGDQYVKDFLNILKKLDLRLYQYLEKNQCKDALKMVTMKWFLCGFLTEYSIDESLNIWDMFMSWPASEEGQPAVLTQGFTYMALSILHLKRQQIMEGENILNIFNNLSSSCQSILVIEKTWSLYRLFPNLMGK